MWEGYDPTYEWRDSCAIAAQAELSLGRGSTSNALRLLGTWLLYMVQIAGLQVLYGLEETTII